jgi:glucosyl-dolichyl phosphate glucuronosyltransferase
VNVTVIVCTYNRCRSLANTLDSVAISVLPESVEWEVLVVDNNSSDGTRDVVEQFLRRYPNRFRYLFEPRQGKSYALNSGIREAQGKILAFMDDDVTVERTWLKNLTSSLRGDEWAGAGGRILPRHAFTSPRWLALDGPYSLVGVLGLFDRGNVAGELDWPPHGANMCFRKEMFERYGFFRTDLGPPPVEVGGEDTEFGRRLVSAGERLRYEASAAVYHDVAEQRLCKEYFLVFFFNFGRSVARQWGRGPDIWGIPRRYFSILKTVTTSFTEKLLPWIFSLNPQRRFFHKVAVWKSAGEIAEFYRLARSKDFKGSMPERNSAQF